MADTIITNTPDRNSGSGDSSAGWVVAFVILIAVIVGGLALYKNGFFTQVAPSTDSTNINVTIPNPTAETPLE